MSDAFELENALDILANWEWDEYTVQQQIYSTISYSLLLKIESRRLTSVAEAWKYMCKEFEDKPDMVKIDKRRRLTEMRCRNGGDLRAHLDAMEKLKEELAGMGVNLPDSEYLPILAASLPPSYRSFVSSITGAVRILGQDIRPDRLASLVLNE